MRTLVLIIALAAPGQAEWPRLVIYEKGSRVDHPEPHALIAFTSYPWRSLDGDICYPCSQENLEWAKSQKARTDLRPLGSANGLQVYDLFYYWRDEEEPAMKSILVRTASDVYHEIYHDEPNEGVVKPSFLVKAGNKQLVCVLENVYRWDAEDDCFWPSPDGVVRLDFGPAWKAAQNAVPAGRRIWEYGIKARTTFKEFVLPVGLRYEYNNRCCDNGVVNVRFRLDRGRIIVTKATFDPDADPADPW